MFVESLDIPLGRVGEAAQRTIERAAAEARRRGHADLTSAHLFVAFAHVEWNLFANIMRDAGAIPHSILLAVETALSESSASQNVVVRIPQATRLLAKLALNRASRAGRQTLHRSTSLPRSSRTNMDCPRRSCGRITSSPRPLHRD